MEVVTAAFGVCVRFKTIEHLWGLVLGVLTSEFVNVHLADEELRVCGLSHPERDAGVYHGFRGLVLLVHCFAWDSYATILTLASLELYVLHRESLWVDAVRKPAFWTSMIWPSLLLSSESGRWFSAMVLIPKAVCALEWLVGFVVCVQDSSLIPCFDRRLMGLHRLTMYLRSVAWIAVIVSHGIRFFRHDLDLLGSACLLCLPLVYEWDEKEWLSLRTYIVFQSQQ